VDFDAYKGSTGFTGTPIAAPRAQGVDTGVIGDGIGTATTIYSSSTEATYCVVARLVASDGSTNLYYAAPAPRLP
jgi:putative effector of murein hydrolase